ncbi:MAG: small ribosomal subunit Rsm22 family protein [Deltaproteobacteria bacterium]|nr:small ribosomal subunit Rsm22 family protein [Deltaproteobacteria bacterium]
MYSEKTENELTLIRSALNELFEESGIKPSEIKKTIERLSREYTGGKTDILKEKDALGYALYFLPEHIPKIYFVLKELGERFGTLLKNTEEIFDLGCGTGTASLIAVALNHCKIPVTLIDKNRFMIQTAEKLLQKIGCKDYRRICRDFTDSFSTSEKRTLYIMMNTLSENVDKSEKILSLIDSILNTKNENLIIIIEPFNTKAKEIMKKIRTEFNNEILLPCINSSLCPLAEYQEGICAFSIRQDISLRLQTVINAGHKMAKFYYLVISGFTKEKEENLFRVLEYPIERKYGFDIRVCSGTQVFIIKTRIKNSAEKRRIGNISPNDIIQISTDNIKDNTLFQADQIQAYKIIRTASKT